MLLCIAAFTSFTSCSKDNEDLIVGKWKCIHSYSYYSDEEDEYERVDENVGDIWEFKSDGTLATDPDDPIVTYSISGSTLTIAAIFVLNFKIDKLTSTTLKLSGSNFGQTKRWEFSKL